MKTTPITRALTLAAGLALIPAAALAAAGHTHPAHESTTARLQLDHGRKWPTDEPLRRGMTALRSDLAGKLPAIHEARLGKNPYAALGRSLEERVGVIVRDCRIPPEADAMLHVVIGELLGAADVMLRKAPGEPAEAAARATHALDDYGRHFDHPGWQPIK